mmetsp:Transcript_31048/g.75721  ORF Transcript_31048/g.75721 Transcript_31048/m.75721 type:complete len:203 (+) Transcript_31048:1203-1811(+)
MLRILLTLILSGTTIMRLHRLELEEEEETLVEEATAVGEDPEDLEEGELHRIPIITLDPRMIMTQQRMVIRAGNFKVLAVVDLETAADFLTMGHIPIHPVPKAEEKSVTVSEILAIASSEKIVSSTTALVAGQGMITAPVTEMSVEECAQTSNAGNADMARGVNMRTKPLERESRTYAGISNEDCAGEETRAGSLMNKMKRT